ncbi:hypothetical protein T492DRAFT_1006355, partial [Pavlovales sp. CCMP2436]
MSFPCPLPSPHVFPMSSAISSCPFRVLCHVSMLSPCPLPSPHVFSMSSAMSLSGRRLLAAACGGAHGPRLCLSWRHHWPTEQGDHPAPPHTRAHTHSHINTRMHTRMHARTHARNHTHTHTRSLTRTHTHTHTQSARTVGPHRSKPLPPHSSNDAAFA